MLRELRKKFILIAMGSLFCVFFLLIFAINAINIANQTDRLNHTMDILMENDGVFPRPIPGERPIRQPGVPEDPETPFIVRYCTVALDGQRNIVGYSMERIAALSQSDAESYTEKVLESGKTSGRMDSYWFRMEKKGNGYLLIFLDASQEEGNMLWVLLITTSIGAAAYLLVFLLVALFSGRAVKPMAESYERQKQFITNVSHELKTPLTVISANCEILSMNFGKNEWCDGIDRQTAKMRRLISRMITLSKMDEEGVQRVMAEFSLSEAVFDTAMAFQNPAERMGKHFSLSVQPDIRYYGSEGDIRQCVSILLDNALKYCDEGGDIRVVLCREKKIRLSVSNTFSKAETLEYHRLFDRFYRADSARSPSSSYGLGLSIARSIVRNHKGTIRARAAGKNQVLFEILL